MTFVTGDPDVWEISNGYVIWIARVGMILRIKYHKSNLYGKGHLMPPQDKHLQTPTHIYNRIVETMSSYKAKDRKIVSQENLSKEIL